MLVVGTIVDIETDKGTFLADSLVLTCGAWTTQLLTQLKLTLPLQVCQSNHYYSHISQTYQIWVQYNYFSFTSKRFSICRWNIQLGFNSGSVLYGCEYIMLPWCGLRCSMRDWPLEYIFTTFCLAFKEWKYISAFSNISFLICRQKQFKYHIGRLKMGWIIQICLFSSISGLKSWFLDCQVMSIMA